MLSRSPLKDPDQAPEADVVIYDGHCAFCRAQVERLRRLDCCGNRLAFLSLHDPRVAERYGDLTHQQLMEQMFVVDRQGGRHGGAEALRYLSRRLPTLWPVAPLLHLPGSARLWRWLYGEVARRRYRWGRIPCDEGGSCKLHFGDDRQEAKERREA